MRELRSMSSWSAQVKRSTQPDLFLVHDSSSQSAGQWPMMAQEEIDSLKLET